MPNSLRLSYPLRCGLLWGLMILLLGAFSQAQATHIRAGDITAKRDTTPNPNPLRFFFTMKIYTDHASSADDPTVQIATGTGVVLTVPKAEHRVVGDPADEVDVEIYRWEYTYPAAGTYTVSWTGINRNPNILNVRAPSDQLTFFISTTININPLRGFNSTPVLTVAPVDLGAVGRVYVHNPGAFDPDGDSLAFKLRLPQQREGASGLVGPVPNYSLPSRTFNCTTSDGSAPAFLSLDLNTGQLVWDAPCVKGEYNVAFVVEEWRVSATGAVKLGEVVRDMQIIVKETPNRPPVLAPKDTCVVAGTTLRGLVRATDPDRDLIDVTVAGSGIVPPATFTVGRRVAGETVGTLLWNTACGDVRERAYQVIFRAEDVRPPGETRLSDLQAWNIRVVGPAPENLAATGADRSVTLSWDAYQCQNASSIRIYRREGPSGFVPDECQTGVPASTGYVLIGEVAADQVSFTDNNQGAGLQAGTEYCYIIYATFPEPGRGESLASNESCVRIAQDIPYLIEVSVDETDALNGRITVGWTQPREVEDLTPPFRYRLLRKQGLEEGSGYVEIFTSSNLDDTTFTDTGLNTLEQGYRYRLEFYQSPVAGGQPTQLRDNTEASSVRLAVAPAPNDERALVLNWTYQVPWNNGGQRHRIYRRIGDGFVLIDSVEVSGNSGSYTDRGTFRDLGLPRGQTYCYYVQTVGSYGIQGLPTPLRNNSQQACALLPRVICAPELSVDALDCQAFSRNPTRAPYQNVLDWVPQNTGDCTDQIAFYTVYFKPRLDAEYVRLGTTTDTRFVHAGLESYAGCYVVTATDTAGRESAFSNEVCKENCISFRLPNIITPNGDGLNDVFRPDAQTAFIRSMKFTVFNRWGVPVYESSASEGGDALYINWPGVDWEGNRLPDGTYYYEAEVEFFSLDPAKARATYKGWVEIVR